MIIINSFARINLGIIDLSSNPYRIDGTHGLYTNLKIATVKIKKNSSLVIDIHSEYKEPLIETVKRCLDYLKKKHKFENVYIHINSLYNRHIGLGSGTQISMSIVEAFNLLFSLDLSLNEKAFLASCGGTSGVGVYCFEYGGYVLDAGRLFPNEKDRIGPSEMFHFNKLPPLVSHLILPNWSICFLLPKNDHYIEGKEEQKLFNEFTPIKQNETDAICKWILKGIMPSIIENNYLSFCYSLEQIMHLGFRAKEINYYGAYLQNRIAIMKKAGFQGIGMTSFGPTLFGFYTNDNIKEKFINILNNKYPLDIALFTNTRNNGAEIIIS